MDVALTARRDRPAGVVVDFDPAVWLVGPTDDDVDGWLARTYAACAADFAVTEGTAEASYLHELLAAFATRDLASDYRFLRLRGLADPPLTALLTVHVGVRSGELAAALTTFDADSTWYDRAPQVAEVDAGRGLRRSMAFAVDDGVRPALRYHRRVDALDADVLLSSAGADLRATAEGLPDLDALACAVWLVDDAGRRR